MYGGVFMVFVDIFGVIGVFLNLLEGVFGMIMIESKINFLVVVFEGEWLMVEIMLVSLGWCFLVW